MVETMGLNYGIDLYHIRMLCEGSLEGGGGYLPSDVGLMSPDQVYFRLCEVAIIKSKTGRKSTKKVSGSQAYTLANDQGEIAARTEEGESIKRPLRIGGKSLATRIREQKRAERENQ